MGEVTGYTKEYIDTHGNGKRVYNRRVADYTLQLTDIGKTIEMDMAGANALTVPPNGTVPFPIGTVIPGIQRGAGQTTITEGMGVTVLSLADAIVTSGQYARYELEKVGINEWYLSGNLG